MTHLVCTNTASFISGFTTVARIRTDLLVKRDYIRRTSWRDIDSPSLKAGEVRLAIDRFALTSNNVSYALFGDRMSYWDFFPAPPGWGRLPASGFANVVESRVDGLREGERIYGFLPTSTEFVTQVGRLIAPSRSSD